MRAIFLTSSRGEHLSGAGPTVGRTGRFGPRALATEQERNERNYVPSLIVRIWLRMMPLTVS